MPIVSHSVNYLVGKIWVCHDHGDRRRPAQRDLRCAGQLDAASDPGPPGAGEATVNELAKPFDLTLPAISKHIKVLEKAGLVVRGHRAQYRPCAIDAAPLEEVSTWAEQYRPVWEARFDRMDDYLTQLGRQRKGRRAG